VLLEDSTSGRQVLAQVHERPSLKHAAGGVLGVGFSGYMLFRAHSNNDEFAYLCGASSMAVTGGLLWSQVLRPLWQRCFSSCFSDSIQLSEAQRKFLYDQAEAYTSGSVLPGAGVRHFPACDLIKVKALAKSSSLLIVDCAATYRLRAHAFGEWTSESENSRHRLPCIRMALPQVRTRAEREQDMYVALPI